MTRTPSFPRRQLTLAGAIATFTLSLLANPGLSQAEARPKGQSTRAVANLHASRLGLTVDAGAHGSMGQGSIEPGSMDQGGPMDAQLMDAGSMDHGSMDHGSIDADSMDHSSMDQGSMHHGSIAIPPGQPSPSLTLSIEPDAMRGWNLHLQVEHFEFAPERVNQSSLTSEGHAHLFINGEKITRLYGPWYYFPALPEGEHELRVELNANGHEVLTVEGSPIEATVRVVVPSP